MRDSLDLLLVLVSRGRYQLVPSEHNQPFHLFELVDMSPDSLELSLFDFDLPLCLVVVLDVPGISLDLPEVPGMEDTVCVGFVK